MMMTTQYCWSYLCFVFIAFSITNVVNRNTNLIINPVTGGPFYAHTDHVIHYMPETIEHRAMRVRNLREMEGQVN